MNIKKFQAPDMKQALIQIKSELGPDAMVVATREIRRGMRKAGIEVTAAVDTAQEPPAAPLAPARALGARDAERLVAPLRSELRSLRAMLRSQSSARQTAELRAEISALRELVTGLGSGHTTRESSATAPSISQLASENELTAPSNGRIVALVGPTGVGKTTTIAKLAGTEALIDHMRVALVTLDTYRVGGQEQMRIFADLIGVPLHIAENASELAEALGKCRDYERVYIDTAGSSPRDTAAIAHLEQALRKVDELEIHLAVSSASSQRMIDATFRRFDRLGIDRLLFTKLDEAEDLTELVRAPARTGKPVSYLTTGQRIPEDLELATQARLVGWATGRFIAKVAA